MKETYEALNRFKRRNDIGAITTADALPTDVEDLAGRLFDLVQTGFERHLVLRLEHAPGADEISRVETELRFLDLFAVYVAIVRQNSPILRQHAGALFERVCIRVFISWAPAWDTKDDLVEVLNGRFAAYNRLVEAAEAEQQEELAPLVGLFAALLIQSDRTVFSDDRHVAGGAVVNAVMELANQHNLLLTTATELFQNRFTAVSRLLSESAAIQTHSVPS